MRRFSILEQILDGTYLVYSFDLFDTVIFRKYLSLDEVIQSSCRYLSGYLKHTHPISELVDERKQIGQLLKYSTESVTQEPKLRHILSSLVSNHQPIDGLSLNEIVSNVISFELSLEQNNLQLNPYIVQVLERLKKDGKQIVCITDMYFDKAQINSILEVLGIKHFFSEVFVSSEIGLTKQTGDLFKYVSNSLSVRPSQILHVGDKLTTDLISARNEGLDSKVVAGSNIQQPVFDKVDNIYRLVAQLSVAFLIDLIQQCHSKNIQKVFFLSRDATFLGEICRALRANYGWLREFFPNLLIVDLEINRITTAFLEIDWRSDKLKNIIELYVANIGQGSLESFLEFCGVSAIESGLMIEDENVDQWIEVIRSKGSVLEEQIIRCIDDKNRIIIEYLDQVGAINSGSVAFVDIGYGGSIARRVATYILRHNSDRNFSYTRIYCFLLLSNNHLLNNSKIARPIGKLGEQGFLNRHSIPGILRGNGSWLEVFYQDENRGPLLGYQRSKDGIITARFDKLESLKLAPRLFTCEQVIGQITAQQAMLFLGQQQSNFVIREFLAEMSNPSSKTVDLLAQKRYLTGDNDLESHPIVTKISVANIFPCRIKQLINNDYWLSGTIQYSGYGWFNSFISPLLFSYYFFSKLVRNFLSKLRANLSEYGKIYGSKLFSLLGIIKAKR